MGFLDDVKAVADRGKPSKTVEVYLNGKVYELVFYRADGDVWAETVARHPLRLDSPLDKRFGYNFNGVVLEVGAKTVRVIEDGVEVEIPENAWALFVHELSGHEVGKITDAVWALNEYDPIQEIEKAKKASRNRGSRGKSA